MYPYHPLPNHTARQYERNGKHFAVEVGPYSQHEPQLVWRGYRFERGGWHKVPCMTRAHERAYPKHLSTAAQNLLKTVKGEA